MVCSVHTRDQDENSVTSSRVLECIHVLLTPMLTPLFGDGFCYALSKPCLYGSTNGDNKGFVLGEPHGCSCGWRGASILDPDS